MPDPITVAAGIGLLWAWWKSKQRTDNQSGAAGGGSNTSSAPDDTKDTTVNSDVYLGGVTPGGIKQGNVELAAGVGGAMGGLVGVMTGNPLLGAAYGVYSTGGGLVGSAVTGGNELATVVGSVAPGYGNALNIGTTIGHETDKALGGGVETELSGGSETAGVGGSEVLTTGNVAKVGFAAMAYAIAVGIGGIILAPLTALAYGIASAITDSQRLSWGQAGAIGELNNKLADVNRRIYDWLHESFEIKDAEDEAFALQLADAYSKAYCRAMNALSFRTWMNSPKGVTLNYLQHAQFGSDRGYFVGTGNVINDPNTKEHIILQETATASWGDIDALIAQHNPAQAAALKAAQHEAEVLANVQQYRFWMGQPRGAFQTDTSHCAWNRNEGKFDGACLKSDNPEVSGQPICMRPDGIQGTCKDGSLKFDDRYWTW